MRKLGKKEWAWSHPHWQRKTVSHCLKHKTQQLGHLDIYYGVFPFGLAFHAPMSYPTQNKLTY